MRDTIPKMTQSHFEFIADTIQGLEWYFTVDRNGKTLANSRFSRSDLNLIAEHFGRALRATNSNFKYDKFIEAATR